MCHFVSLNQQTFAKCPVLRIVDKYLLGTRGVRLVVASQLSTCGRLVTFALELQDSLILEGEAYTVSLATLPASSASRATCMARVKVHSSSLILTVMTTGQVLPCSASTYVQQHQQDQSVCHPTVFSSVGQTKGLLWRRKGELTLLHYQSPVNHNSTTKRILKQLHKQNPLPQQEHRTR